LIIEYWVGGVLIGSWSPLSPAQSSGIKEEICVELDDPKGNRIEQGDYIMEFITPDKPKILLVIKGEQE